MLKMDIPYEDLRKLVLILISKIKSVENKQRLETKLKQQFPKVLKEKDIKAKIPKKLRGLYNKLSKTVR